MQTVSQFMDEDHARLNKLWEEFLSEKKQIYVAHERLNKFTNHLEKHILLEDTILFPRFNAYIGFEGDEGPVGILSRDHDNIYKLLEGIRLVIMSNNLAQVLREGNNLKKLFDKHLEREFQMGYPICDTFVTPDEWKKLVEGVYGEEYLNGIKANLLT